MKIIHKPSPFLLAAALIAMFGLASCNNNQTPANTAPADQSQTQPAAAPDQSQQDPAAAANLAPASETQAAPSQSNDNSGSDDYDNEDSDYGQPALQASDAPPELPEYSQPDCPGDGYLWTPGYWSYGSQGYFWVPGAWTRPPEVGLLWTPGWWGFNGGRYRFHYGFWGRHVGYYGGVNYGFGYRCV